MKKLFQLSLFIFILSSCGGKGGGAADTSKNPGLFNKEIKTPTPNEHRGLWQANFGTAGDFAMTLRMFVEEEKSQFTLRCQNSGGTIYANLEAPTQLEFTPEQHDSVVQLRFLQAAAATSRASGMQCGLSFSSGEFLSYFANELSSGITLPNNALDIGFYSEGGLVGEVGNWPHENIAMDKISD